MKKTRDCSNTENATPAAPVATTEAPKAEATPAPAVAEPVRAEETLATRRSKKTESGKRKRRNKEVAKVEVPAVATERVQLK